MSSKFEINASGPHITMTVPAELDVEYDRETIFINNIEEISFPRHSGPDQIIDKILVRGCIEIPCYIHPMRMTSGDQLYFKPCGLNTMLRVENLFLPWCC